MLGNIEVERHYSNSLRLMANLLNGLDSKQLDPSAATDLALRTIEEAISELWLTVQEQRLEFLAKRLLYGRSPSSHEKRCFLASPLYVAFAE